LFFKSAAWEVEMSRSLTSTGFSTDEQVRNRIDSRGTAEHYVQLLREKGWMAAAIMALALCGCISSCEKLDELQPGRLVRFEQNDKFGFKDENGRVVIKPTYDDAGDFAFGLAPVNRGARWEFPGIKDGGKWGYINARGKVIVPLRFSYAHEFSDGLAWVCDDRGERYLDPEGKTLIRLPEGTSGGDFREGVAPVRVDRSLQNKDWQTRFINKAGETVFVVDGYADEFHEALAVLQVSHETDLETFKYGFIDHTGKVVIAPQFAQALHFNEGLAPVIGTGTAADPSAEAWGYIDKSGNYVLKPQFNQADHFRNGIARVHIGGTWVEVWDWVGPPIYAGGEWQLIDAKGNVLRRREEWIPYEDVVKKSLKAAQ